MHAQHVRPLLQYVTEESHSLEQATDYVMQVT